MFMSVHILSCLYIFLSLVYICPYLKFSIHYQSITEYKFGRPATDAYHLYETPVISCLYLFVFLVFYTFIYFLFISVCIMSCLYIYLSHVYVCIYFCFTTNQFVCQLSICQSMCPCVLLIYLSI